MSYASLFPLPSSPRIIPGFTSSTTISNGTRSTPSWIAWPSTFFAPFGPYSRIGSARAWSPSVRISPITPRKWSAWKWVKKISDKAKLTPYRIIWRCVPSPHSNSSVSPSRMRAIAETLRSTVGRAALVPKKVTESMAGNIGRHEAAQGGKRRHGAPAALCRLLPPVAALKDLYRQIPPRPFFQIRQELRQGLERRIEILVEQSVGRNLPKRPFSLIHLVEQSLERSGRVGQPSGQLGEIGAQRVEPLAGLRRVGGAEQRVQVRHHALERCERRLSLLDRWPVGRLGERLHALLRRDQRVVNVARELARVEPLVHVRNQLLRALCRPLRHVGELLLGDALNGRSRREQAVSEAGIVV